MYLFKLFSFNFLEGLFAYPWWNSNYYQSDTQIRFCFFHCTCQYNSNQFKQRLICREPSVFLWMSRLFQTHRVSWRKGNKFWRFIALTSGCFWTFLKINVTFVLMIYLIRSFFTRNNDCKISGEKPKKNKCYTNPYFYYKFEILKLNLYKLRWYQYRGQSFSYFFFRHRVSQSLDNLLWKVFGTGTLLQPAC